MKTTTMRNGLRHSLIALAVASAFGPAFAQQASSTSITVGAGVTSADEQDRARFGLFNDLRDDRANGLFDFSFVSRDPASGLWTTIEGRNLFQDTREVGLSTRKLGDWKIAANYSEILRSEPRTINTAMQGAGTTSPTIVRLATPGTGSDVNLTLHRKAFTLSGMAWLGGTLQFEGSVKSEDKDGARIFGKGFACSATWRTAGVCATSTSQWLLLLMPEPVDSTITQADAKFTFHSGGLLLTGGYYGNLYVNRNGNISATIPGTLNNPLGAATAVDTGLQAYMGSPLALPPDSQAHKLYVSGRYAFTKHTSATFKYAYTHATQNEDFGGTGFYAAPAGRSNLGGEINTTLLQAGITSKPLPKLHVSANVRYEKKDNKTPIAQYNVEGTEYFTNGAPSPRKLETKLEASYQLPGGYRAALGADFENDDHGAFTSTDSVAGLSGLRQKTKEAGYRAELRRSLAEDLTGSISFVHSKREGDSPWLRPLSLSQGRGVIEANDDPSCVPPASPAINNCIYNRTGIFPFVFQDRKRDKVRAMASWVPTDQLSLQFFVESGKDDYTAPSTKGLDNTKLANYSVDATYAINDDWRLSAYATRGDSKVVVAHSTGYMAEVKDQSDAFGVTLKGKASEKLALSADLTYLNDTLKYEQGLDASASAANVAFLAASGGLPDVTYKLLRLKLVGDYALDKRSSIKLALVHERSKFNEWAWQWNGNAFLFSDNTTITAKEDQSVTFVGATYSYRW